MKTRPHLYPLKFTPILKQKVWGGNKLKQLFNKKSKLSNIGESWELSGVQGSISVVENGVLQNQTLNELIKEYKSDFVGEKVFNNFGTTFPLLFKFIDAAKDLSVQLHPNDVLAKQRHNSFGKTEMWYIMQCEKDAKLILGFNQEVNKKKYLNYLSKNNIIDLLHFEKVKKGDSFFIATGTIHAIGAGIVLAEIQQTSDITYRVYDWDRPGIDGKMRTLHNDLALEAILFSNKKPKLNYEIKENKPVTICKSLYFKTNHLLLTKNKEYDLSPIDSFVVYMCVDGHAIIETKTYSETIEKGETVLIPACIEKMVVKTKAVTLLEVYIP